MKFTCTDRLRVDAVAAGTNTHCQVPRMIAQLLTGGACGVGYLGGSVTQARGASDTAETSWRALFQKYLYQRFERKYYCHLSQVYSGMGGCSSPIGAFMVGRNLLAAEPALVFVEFCINDSHVLDKTLVAKGVEGIIRQLLTAKKRCEVVLLGVGCSGEASAADGSAGTVPQELHREIASHYDVLFIDMQDYLKRYLEEHGLEWDDVMSLVEGPDVYHVNDLGNQIYCEALQEAFEEQFTLYNEHGEDRGVADICVPLVSDELQFVKLLDPARKNNSLTCEGDWARRPQGTYPWYMDNVMMGAPGAKMRLQFDGTAVMIWCMLYYNGLKVDAVLDGEELAGPYLLYPTEAGRGFVLAHGLAQGSHTLALTVAAPSKRHNKWPNPTAQVGGIGIASKTIKAAGKASDG